MLNININYPYPVIREYADDFVKTIFQGELAVCLEDDGYFIHPSFKVNNIDINKMILEGDLSFAIEVQCVSTWFRKLYEIHDNQVIKLNPQQLHERVEIIPCIIAKREIKDYTNIDFAEEYLEMKFEVNAGDVVGIGKKRTFDALYQNDIIKNGSSIVSISGSESNKEIYCDFSGSVINILLPIDQYENYKDCGYNKVKYKMLNAILTIPALVEAIGIVRADENDDNQNSGFESKAWYKTIVANIKRYAENDENKYLQMLDKPFATAELLLGDNSAKALDFLSKLD